MTSPTGSSGEHSETAKRRPLRMNGERRRHLTMALQPIPARVTVSVGCIISAARRAG